MNENCARIGFREKKRLKLNYHAKISQQINQSINQSIDRSQVVNQPINLPGTVPYSYDFLILLIGNSWSAGKTWYMMGSRSAALLEEKQSQILWCVALWMRSRPQSAMNGCGSGMTSGGRLKRGSSRASGFMLRCGGFAWRMDGDCILGSFIVIWKN